MEENLNQSHLEKYIFFEIEDMKLCSPLKDVEEIIDFEKIEKIPGSSSNFLGLLNVRGETAYILQIHKNSKLEVKPESHKIMIFRSNHSLLGSCITKLNKVIDLQIESFDRNPSIKAHLNNKFIIGTVLDDNHIVTGIDMSLLLSEEKMINNIQTIK